MNKIILMLALTATGISILLLSKAPSPLSEGWLLVTFLLSAALSVGAAVSVRKQNFGPSFSRKHATIFALSAGIAWLCWSPANETLYLTMLPGAAASIVAYASAVALMLELLGLASEKA